MKVEMQPAEAKDRRSSERVSAQLEGKLFVPAEERTLEFAPINDSWQRYSVYSRIA